MKEHVKRPKLALTEPIRNWSTLLGGAATAAAGGAGASGLSDVIAASVDLGYRVIDEYVRQGQKAAERMTGRSTEPAAITGDAQELAARMAQYSSDLMQLWLQMLGAAGSGAVPGAAPAPAAAASPAPPAAEPPSTGEVVRVRVEVASVQPVEVGLDVRPGTGAAPLIVHALRAVDPDKPALTATVVPDEEGGAVRLRVQVPDDHPAGVYSGLLIDERSNLPVGALSVRVGRG